MLPLTMAMLKLFLTFMAEKSVEAIGEQLQNGPRNLRMRYLV